MSKSPEVPCTEIESTASVRNVTLIQNRIADDDRGDPNIAF